MSSNRPRFTRTAGDANGTDSNPDNVVDAGNEGEDDGDENPDDTTSDGAPVIGSGEGDTPLAADAPSRDEPDTEAHVNDTSADDTPEASPIPDGNTSNDDLDTGIQGKDSTNPETNAKAEALRQGDEEAKADAAQSEDLAPGESLLNTNKGNGPVKGLAALFGGKRNIYEPGPNEKPYNEIGFDELVERLKNSGIEVTADDASTTVGRGYVNVTIGDGARPGMASNTLQSEEDALSWVHHEVLRLFPASDYTLTYGKLAPKDNPNSLTN